MNWKDKNKHAYKHTHIFQMKWIFRISANTLFCHLKGNPFSAIEKWPFYSLFSMMNQMSKRWVYLQFGFCYCCRIKWIACIWFWHNETIENAIQSIKSFILRFQLASVIVSAKYISRIGAKKNVFSIWATHERWTHVRAACFIIVCIHTKCKQTEWPQIIYIWCFPFEWLNSCCCCCLFFDLHAWILLYEIFWCCCSRCVS